MIDSWCMILGNELFHGMLIADNDVVPLVEQRIHCCRYYDAEEKEAAYVAGHDASVVGIEKDKLYFVHDIDIAVVRERLLLLLMLWVRMIIILLLLPLLLFSSIVQCMMGIHLILSWWIELAGGRAPAPATKDASIR